MTEPPEAQTIRDALQGVWPGGQSTSSYMLPDGIRGPALAALDALTAELARARESVARQVADRQAEVGQLTARAWQAEAELARALSERDSSLRRESEQDRENEELEAELLRVVGERDALRDALQKIALLISNSHSSTRTRRAQEVARAVLGGEAAPTDRSRSRSGHSPQ